MQQTDANKIKTVLSVADKKEYQVLSVMHEFRYTFDEPILVSDLITSLKAYEVLTSSYLPAILNQLFGVDVYKVQVAVSEIERGSFLEKLIFDIFFKDENAYREFCSKIRAYLKLEKEDGNINMSRIIMLAMAALLGVGAGYLLFKSPQEMRQDVTNNVITVINADDSIAIDGGHLVEVVKEVTAGSKQKAADNVAKVYAPASKNNGSITLGMVSDDVVIEPIAQKNVADLPKEVDLSTPPLTEDFTDIDVQIRAADRDKNTGWYAVIDRVVPSRVRLELPEDIDLNKLANNAIIRADVTVEYELRKNGSRKPKKIVLTSLQGN